MKAKNQFTFPKCSKASLIINNYYFSAKNIYLVVHLHNYLLFIRYIIDNIRRQFVIYKSTKG